MSTDPNLILTPPSSLGPRALLRLVRRTCHPSRSEADAAAARHVCHLSLFLSFSTSLLVDLASSYPQVPTSVQSSGQKYSKCMNVCGPQPRSSTIIVHTMWNVRKVHCAGTYDTVTQCKFIHCLLLIRLSF